MLTKYVHRLQRPFARPVLSTPYRWEKAAKVLDGKDIVLFASYAPSGALRQYTQSYVSALRDQGFYVVLILIVDDLGVAVDRAACGDADAILVRGNAGFDFAAWGAALELMPSAWNAGLVVFANDSVFGPFAGFPAMVERLRASTADVIGLTESTQKKRHLQSYFLALKPGALRSAGMQQFWRRVRNLPTKREVIHAYEIQFLAHAERAGLRAEALFPLAVRPRRAKSPTHDYWRKLIESGFPFLKVDLLREAPADITGWAAFLTERGVDIAPIVNHLRAVAPHAESLRELEDRLPGAGRGRP
jgi:lipopolysaccharide biosynthesis protein